MDEGGGTHRQVLVQTRANHEVSKYSKEERTTHSLAQKVLNTYLEPGKRLFGGRVGVP